MLRQWYSYVVYVRPITISFYLIITAPVLSLKSRLKYAYNLCNVRMQVSIITGGGSFDEGTVTFDACLGDI